MSISNVFCFSLEKHGILVLSKTEIVQECTDHVSIGIPKRKRKNVHRLRCFWVGHTEHSGNSSAWSREDNVNLKWPLLIFININEPKYSQFNNCYSLMLMHST